MAFVTIGGNTSGLFKTDEEKQDPNTVATAVPGVDPSKYTTVPTVQPNVDYFKPPEQKPTSKYTTVPTTQNPNDYFTNPIDINNTPKPPPLSLISAPPQIGGFQPPAPTYAANPNTPTFTPTASVSPIVAAQAGGVTIGGANTVANTPVADAKLANSSLAANTTINSTDQDQTRAQQKNFLQMLHDAAYGTGGPSAAEALYKKNAEDALRSQFGLAASQHGYAGASAMRQAAFNAAGIQQKAALDSAIIRAQEQQAARGLLGESLTSTRDADQKLSIAQGQLDAAQKALNAQLQTTTNINNADEQNKLAQLKAQLDQATAFRNAAADEATRAHQADIDLSNNQFNTGQTNATNQFNNQQEQQRNLLDSQLRQQLGISLAQLEQNNNQFNATQGQQNTQYFSGLQNQRDIAQLQATLQAMGYNNDQINSFMRAYAGSAGAVSAQDTANRQNNDRFFWDVVNVGSSFLPGGSVGGAVAKSAASPRPAVGNPGDVPMTPTVF